MTVFEDKNRLELRILAMAMGDRASAQTVTGICDRSSWYHRSAFIAIDQMAKHGKILDQHIRDEPEISDALQLRLSPAPEELERLCWNHVCITNADTQMTLLQITARPGYEDLRTVLEAIHSGNMDALAAL